MSTDEYTVPDWLDVSRETIAKLEQFLDLVNRWNPKINLVSAASLPTAWTRHVLDSAQIWSVRETGIQSWLDIGSGGGFPGLIVAILAQAEEPDMTITLVESDQRKATFLRVASQELKLKTEIICDRIERLAPLGAEILSARALAPLKELLPYVQRHLVPGGTALFLKGERVEAEIQEAQLSWNFDVDMLSSKTDDKAIVLKIRDIQIV